MERRTKAEDQLLTCRDALIQELALQALEEVVLVLSVEEPIIVGKEAGVESTLLERGPQLSATSNPVFIGTAAPVTTNLDIQKQWVQTRERHFLVRTARVTSSVKLSSYSRRPPQAVMCLLRSRHLMAPNNTSEVPWEASKSYLNSLVITVRFVPSLLRISRN